MRALSPSGPTAQYDRSMYSKSEQPDLEKVKVYSSFDQCTVKKCTKRAFLLSVDFNSVVIAFVHFLTVH